MAAEEMTGTHADSADSRSSTGVRKPVRGPLDRIRHAAKKLWYRYRIAFDLVFFAAILAAVMLIFAL